MVAQSGCTLQYILLTHGHFDHTSAVRPLLEKYPDVPVYIHEKDAADTERGELLFRKVGPENQRFYKEGDTLPLGSLTIRVLEMDDELKQLRRLVVMSEEAKTDNTVKTGKDKS